LEKKLGVGRSRLWVKKRFPVAGKTMGGVVV